MAEIEAEKRTKSQNGDSGISDLMADNGMVLDKEEKECYVLEFKRVRFSFLVIFLGRRALNHPKSLKLTYGMRRDGTRRVI